MIVRAYLNSLLSLVKSGLIYCAAARHVDGAKKWDGKQAVDTPSSTNTSLCRHLLGYFATTIYI